MQPNQIPPQHQRPTAPHPESYQQGQIPPTPMSSGAGTMPMGAGGQQQYYAAAAYQQQMAAAQQQQGGFYHGQPQPPAQMMGYTPQQPSQMQTGYYARSQGEPPASTAQQRMPPVSMGAGGMIGQQQAHMAFTQQQQQQATHQSGQGQGVQMFPSSVHGDNSGGAATTRPTFPSTTANSGQQIMTSSGSRMSEHPSSTPTVHPAQQQMQTTTVSGTAITPAISPTSAQEQRWAQLRPAPLPREMFDGVTAAITSDHPSPYSVEALCSIGREATHDLLNRALNAMSVAKMDVANTNRNAPIDMATVLSYSKWMFQRLIEIRLLIDRIRQKEATTLGHASIATLSDEDLFEYLATKPQSAATADRANAEEHKTRLEAEFDDNRAVLLELSAELKRLDWLAAVGEPLLMANGLSGNGWRGVSSGHGEGTSSAEMRR